MTGITLRSRAQQQFDDSGLYVTAFAVARAGRLDEALDLASNVDQREKESALMWVVRGAAAAGDVEGAERMSERLQGKISHESAARWAAEEFAKRKRTAELTTWVESRPTEHAKFAARIGAAECIVGRRFWEPRLGF